MPKQTLTRGSQGVGLHPGVAQVGHVLLLRRSQSRTPLALMLQDRTVFLCHLWPWNKFWMRSVSASGWWCKSMRKQAFETTTSRPPLVSLGMPPHRIEHGGPVPALATFPRFERGQEEWGTQADTHPPTNHPGAPTKDTFAMVEGAPTSQQNHALGCWISLASCVWGSLCGVLHTRLTLAKGHSSGFTLFPIMHNSVPETEQDWLLWRRDLGATGTVLFPVSSLLGYLAVRPPTICKVKAFASTFYLYSITSMVLKLAVSISTLSRPRLVQSLRQALSSVVDDSPFSRHSFRIRAATTAAKAGINNSVIQTLGRWKSSAFTLYIRTPPQQLRPALGCQTCCHGEGCVELGSVALRATGGCLATHSPTPLFKCGPGSLAVGVAQPICRKVALMGLATGCPVAYCWGSIVAVVVQMCTLPVWCRHARTAKLGPGTPGWHPCSRCCSSHSGEWPL